MAQLCNEAWIQKYGRRYKEIFENSSDAVFVVEVSQRRDFYFDSLNPAAAKAIGQEEFIFEGLRLNEISCNSGDPELRRILHEMQLYLAQSLDSSLPVKYESTFYFAAHEIPRTYDINLVPMADDSGIGHIFCFAQEVTARKLYEQELLSRISLEDKLAGFATSIPGFLCSYKLGADGSTSMPFASAGISDLFDLRPGEVAENVGALNKHIYPDDVPLLAAATARSAADLSLMIVEFRASHPRNGIIWIELRAMPILELDGSILWHGFMYEITNRKLLEDTLRKNREHLANAQRIGQMGSWELDLVNGDLSWSNEIYRIFEIDASRFDATYEAFLNAIHPDDRDAVNSAYATSVENHTEYCIDHRLLFADGRIKHVRECCETHYDDNGKPLQSCGTVQDITELKNTEAQLNAIKDRLRQLVIAREALHEDESKRISWEVHEELGQLLAAMKMRVFGIRTQLPRGRLQLDEDCGVVISLIDRSIKTIHDIVTDLRPTILLHGIVATLEWLVAETNRHPDLNCELEVNEDGTIISEELTTLIFRVVQESLEYIGRQVGASRVIISWDSNKNLHYLTIRYDGNGYINSLAGEKMLSFFGMQERVTAYGGEMRISYSHEQGSVIEARFPASEATVIQYPLFVN